MSAGAGAVAPRGHISARELRRISATATLPCIRPYEYVPRLQESVALAETDPLRFGAHSVGEGVRP